MRTSNLQKAPIQTMQSAVVKEDIKKHLGHMVDVIETTGNQRYTHYQGKFLSISTNLFTIEMPLGKTNKAIKSFPINDVIIGKITINNLD